MLYLLLSFHCRRYLPHLVKGRANRNGRIKRFISLTTVFTQVVKLMIVTVILISFRDIDINRQFSEI